MTTVRHADEVRAQAAATRRRVRELQALSMKVLRAKWYPTPAQVGGHARSAQQARTAAERAQVRAAEASGWAAEAYQRVLDRNQRPAEL